MSDQSYQTVPISSAKPKPSSRSTWLAPLYGVINGILLIPVSISFTSIIYSDPFFQPYLPQLVKLVLFSSLVHQIAFTALSSLPFAVGQVQDAGLVFLSAMSTTTVASMRSANPSISPESVLSTVIVELSLSTLLLGIALVIMGRLKLGSIVQYLPVPVIGGYLAFIGFFCGRAGLAMMSGPLPLQWLPGCAMGCLMYLLLSTVKSPLVLPTCMVSMLLVFYGLVVWFSGWTLQDARDYGWIWPLQEQSNGLAEITALVSFSTIQWGEMSKQGLCWLGMVLVVAFSSSLDVAAIEMELGLPLDYNKELAMVGVSNVLSGCSGGYTGSYIFSQTIFTMKRGVFSRLCGVFIALLEATVVVLPISLTSYVPKLFFGSLLMLISVDLMWVWLVLARRKMMIFEYGVCLATFAAILCVGVEGGLAFGVLFASVAFVVSNASIARATPSFKSSNVVRTFEERSVLLANRAKIVTLSLSGYVFFGSAVKILEEVKAHVILNATGAGPGEDMPVLSDLDFEETFEQQGNDENDEENGTRRGKSRERGRKRDQGSSLFIYTPMKSKSASGGGMRSRAQSEGSFGSRDSWKTSPSKPHPSSSSSSPDTVSEAMPMVSHGLVQSPSYGSIEDSFASPGSSLAASTSCPGSPAEPDMAAALSDAPGGKPISIFDISDEVIGRLHERVEMQLGNPNPNPNDAPSEGQAHSLLHTVWSQQNLFREARKRGSFGSQLEMLLRQPPEKNVAHRDEEATGNPNATEYLVLDFTHTSGVDATAARSCFLMLMQLMKASHVTVVFANMSPSVRSVLTANGVIRPRDVVIPRLDDALEWCEEIVLGAALRRQSGLLKRDLAYYQEKWQLRQGLGLGFGSGELANSGDVTRRADSGDDKRRAVSFESSSVSSVGSGEANRELASHSRRLRSILLDYLEVKNDGVVKNLLSTQLLVQFFVRSSVRGGDILIDMHQPSDHIVFIEAGEVELVCESTDGAERADGDACRSRGAGVERVNKIAAGGIFGEASFVLGTSSSLRALALSDCVVWSLSRFDFTRMELQEPRMCLLIQQLLLKSLSINATAGLFRAFPETAYNNLFD